MQINTKFNVGEIVTTPADLSKLISDDEPLENIHFWEVSEIRVVQEKNNTPCVLYELQIINSVNEADKSICRFTDGELISIDIEFKSFMSKLKKLYDRYEEGSTEKAPETNDTHDWVVPPYEKGENGDLVELKG